MARDSIAMQRRARGGVRTLTRAGKPARQETNSPKCRSQGDPCVWQIWWLFFTGEQAVVTLISKRVQYGDSRTSDETKDQHDMPSFPFSPQGKTRRSGKYLIRYSRACHHGHHLQPHTPPIVTSESFKMSSSPVDDPYHDERTQDLENSGVA